MEDDSGLELSLGLACGGSSSKDTSDNSADGRTDTDERTSKILNDFRKFLNADVPQPFRTTNPVKHQDNFNLHQTAFGGNDSVNESGGCDKKRKSIYFGIETSNKKQVTESYSSVVQGKGKNSHISVTTDDGSTGDNEDVAESGVEGSTSRCVFRRDDGSRTVGGSASSKRAPKKTTGQSSNSATSFPVQAMNILGVPYSINFDESSSVSAPSTPIYPIAMQSVLTENGGQSIHRVTSTGSLPVSSTYSSMKIADNDCPWGMARSQLVYSPYAGSSIPTSVSMQVTNLNSSEPTQPDVYRWDQLRGPQKPVAEEGSSSQLRLQAGARVSSSFQSEYPAIRPGIAAELKFDGFGSFPDLPWVSTTGLNGKTISGVTYQYTATQIRIVCACHGLHLSPEEFLRHASEDQPSAITSSNVASPATASAMTDCL
ncbi:hypothetical protein vseg_016342 [Gypsophila vaccaria]